MRFKTIAAVAAVLALAGPALAADPYTPAKDKAPASAPADLFAGFYAGLNGGYGWADTLSFREAFEATDKTALYNLRSGVAPSGGFGGGQIGYNVHSRGSSFIWGVEADIQGANIDASSRVSGTAAQTEDLKSFIGGLTGGSSSYTNAGTYAISASIVNSGTGDLTYTVTPKGGTATTQTIAGGSTSTVTIPVGATVTYVSGGGNVDLSKSTVTTTDSCKDCAGSSKSTVDWFGTVRLRGGFLAGDALYLYGTGGFAYGGVGNRTANDAYDLAADATRLGWTVGAGAEYAFAPRWSIKVEYLYIDLLGDRLSGIVPDSTKLVSSSSPDTIINTVRVGMNYHLGSDVIPLH